ncbi:MAG: FtsH protease activity modulator HflK [Hyphomonadaceae bacterium]|nr:FtsH protease activity modulator HflK [Hyphomonadaceae bacterium]MBP9234937.1 FtsH protease activity modulator HflK [Hyphomonadaceae bacterium]
MPWNDNKGSGGGGGPWGGGGNNNNGESPWGKPGGGNKPGGSGGGGGKDRPDLEETLRRMQERFKRKDGGGSNGGSGGGGGLGRGRSFGAMGLIIILAIGVVGWLFTGIYQVNEQERAVVLRFGTFHRYEEPGFRIRLPNPIERHIVVPVNTEIRTEIGGTNTANLMLTGDENIIDIDFVINWRVFEPRDYLFNVVDVEGGNPDNHVLVEQIGESAMREIVGTSAFEPITTTGRTVVETRVRDLMQQTLNSYKAGIEVISISLRGASAPEEVVSVQREVSSAEQDKAKREAEAIAYRNKVVPEAEGQAQRVIQEAEGYKAASVANARGEADRFNLVYEQYRAAPRVTRERMFLETMEKVIGRTDQVILDGKSGAVPILPLDQLRGRQQTPQGQ